MADLKEQSIALIIPDFDYGGEEKRAVFFLNNYIKYFKQVYLFAPDGKSTSLLNKDVIHVKINTRNLAKIGKVISLINKHNISYIQGHKRFTFPYLLAAEKLTNAICVFNYDNIYLTGNKLYSYLAPKNILYLSDVMKDFYSSYYPLHNNLTVNMGGDFFNTYSPNKVHELKVKYQVDGKFVILSLGRLFEQKNHQLLIEAIKNIKTKNFVCLVAGNGPLEAQLKQQVNQFGLNKYVQFLGHCTQIEELLNIADVLVQSSIYEGFPNVFIEAASVAVPIIATNVGSSKTLVNENGILVDSGDSKQLTEAILKMMNNHWKYTKAAKAFKETSYFKQFNKTEMLNNYIKYYENI